MSPPSLIQAAYRETVESMVPFSLGILYSNLSFWGRMQRNLWQKGSMFFPTPSYLGSILTNPWNNRAFTILSFWGSIQNNLWQNEATVEDDIVFEPSVTEAVSLATCEGMVPLSY